MQRGDYYDEGLARWDREGLQSDLKLARSAIKQAAKERFEAEKDEPERNRKPADTTRYK